MREVPKDVLKMASGLISPSGLAGHRRPLCTGQLNMRPADGDGGYYHDTDKKLHVKLSASI